MSNGVYQELQRELSGLVDGITVIKNPMTARLGDGTDAGNVIVAPADRHYPTWPLFWVYTETNGTKDVFQAVPTDCPGITWDNSQRHMEVWLVRKPYKDPKVWFIDGFTNIGLAAWGGATPAQVGLQQAAAVTPDKILTNSIYFSSGLTLGFRGGGARFNDVPVVLGENTSFADLTSYVPGSANKERWVFVGINATGVAGIVVGDEFDDSETNKANFAPKTIPVDHLDLGWVLLSNGLVTGTNDRIIRSPNTSFVPSDSSATETELASLTDVTSATQTANFVFAAGDGATGGEYRGRLLVDADIPGTLTITGGTINNAPIGGTTPAPGTFTTVTATSNIVGTGLVQVQAGASTAFLRVQAQAGQARVLDFMSASSLRWRFNCTPATEGGGNTGSDFTQVRLADDGVTALGTPISIVRSSGLMTLSGNVVVVTPAAATVPLKVRGAAAQTANLLDIENSSSTVLSAFNAAGNLGIGTATPATELQVVGTGFLATFGTTSAGVQISNNQIASTGTTDLILNGSQGGEVAIGTLTPLAKLHVDQSSTTGAIPVLTVDQADVSEEFIRFIGSSANGVLTQSIVEAADVATPTIAGYLKIFVQDDGNQLTDQAYFLPIYTLA